MVTRADEGPAVHEWTGPTGVKFRDVREPSGTYYRDTTPRGVVEVLERAMKAGNMRTGKRVRLFLGDRETGKCWHDEHDVCGTVGRSMGPIKIPLLIANRRSYGGGAILTDCIVRILVDGREEYVHPKFDNGEFVARKLGLPEDKELLDKGYTHGVDIDGKRRANFKSSKAALRWMNFMLGERMCK